MAEATRVELVEVVNQLRTELNAAVAQAAGERLQFELGPIELTLSVAITEETTAGGQVGSKIRFWVVDGDTRATASHTGSTVATQQVKLVLNPVDQQADTPTGGRPAKVRIAGTALPGEA